jgi:hypothetical protein
MDQQAHLRRFIESLRRHVKVKSYFGTVPIPVGGHSTLIFHLNNKKDHYILLNAQTQLLDGKITYDQVKAVAEEVCRIQKQGHGWRECLYEYIHFAAYLVIILTFVLFFGLLVLLTKTDGNFFGIAFAIYTGLMLASIFLLVYG